MLAERVKEWNRESMERGMRTGMQKGMQKGARQLLLRQLEKKFKVIPSDIKQRLEEADGEQILEWSERILTAADLGDIFGD